MVSSLRDLAYVESAFSTSGWISRNVKSSYTVAQLRASNYLWSFVSKFTFLRFFFHSPEYKHYTRRNILLQFSEPNSRPLQFLSTLLWTDFDRRILGQLEERGLWAHAPLARGSSAPWRFESWPDRLDWNTPERYLTDDRIVVVLRWIAPKW